MAKKNLTAENIGVALGRLANKIDEWRRQRDDLVAEGERVALMAQAFVRELRGHAARPDAAPASNERTRKGGRPKGMKMSEETKAKLREAWKRRKAGATSAAQGRAADRADKVAARKGRGRKRRRA